MIAIVRHEDAGVLRRLEDRRASRHADLSSFDGEVDHLLCHHATAGTKWCFVFLINASKSGANFLIPLETGVAHESESTQIVLPVMLSPIESSVSRSSGV